MVEVGDKVFVSPLHGQKDNLAVIKTKTPEVGDKVFVSPLHGQKDNLAVIDKRPGPPPPPTDFLVDISPTSSYYISKSSWITWAGAPSSYLRAYNMKTEAYDEDKYVMGELHIDLTDLMADMTAPVIAIYPSFNSKYLKWSGDRTLFKLYVYTANNHLIAACHHFGLDFNGRMQYMVTPPAVIGSLAGYESQTLRMEIGAGVKSVWHNTVEGNFRILGYVGLYDAKV